MEFIIALVGMDMCHHLVMVSHVTISMNAKTGHKTVQSTAIVLTTMVLLFVNATMDIQNLPTMELIVVN